MNDFLLVVKVLGLERLDQTMGALVADSALADLAPHVAHLTTQALTLAHTSAPAEPLLRGCWSAPFSLRDSSPIGNRIDESIDSISAAAQEMANDAALQVFGAGSAPLASVSVACLAPTVGQNLDREVRRAAHAALHVPSQAALNRVLDQNLLRTVFQPIVAFPSGKIVGFEALTRGAAQSGYERADQLFGAAARSGLTYRLEMACAAQALTFVQEIPEPLWMSVNVSSGTLAELDSFLVRRQIPCNRLIVELTEHLPLGQIDALHPVLDSLRAKGARIALDDTGCGYADLDAAARMNADVVKLCMTVIGRLERHPLVRALVAEAVAHAHSYGALVLAEGVETTAQVEILAEIGIDLAQGWLYGKPFPVADLADRAQAALAA